MHGRRDQGDGLEDASQFGFELFTSAGKADQVELMLLGKRFQQAMNAKSVTQPSAQDLVGENQNPHAGRAESQPISAVVTASTRDHCLTDL